jgi:AraC-like DNA-binding protein
MGGYSLSIVFNFCIAIISLIVLFDVIYKHRRNNSLLVSFILIILPIFFNTIVINYVKNSSILFNIIQFNKITFIIGCLMLLNYLCYNSLKKYIYITSFLIYGLFMIKAFCFFYYKLEYIPDENIYYNFEIQPLHNSARFGIFNGIRIIIVLFSFVSFFFFWKKIVINSKNDNLYYNKLKSFTNLILIFIGFILLLFFAKLFFKSLFNFKINFVIQFLMPLYILLVIFYRPDFLNKISTSKLALINKFNLSGDFALDSRKFDQLFFIELSYISNNFNISSFADQLNIKKEDLVNYINNRFGLTFDDLVNKHRIEYFVELIKNPNFKNYTIDALSKEAGFVSRNAFYKPFKKFHGGNPSDLIDLFS